MNTFPLIYQLENNLNPAPYKVEVYRDESLDQYQITITILGKKYSRMEKTKTRAVEIAKKISDLLESAFKYTWEDNS